jgi:RNA polymerase sigma-70 factor, ECF subfamily
LKQLLPDEERSLLLQLPKNPEAFLPLYQHYFPRVFGYVAYRVGSKQDAEDITADIFLRVIQSIGRFEYRGAGSFATWVYRIAHNAVQQFYRVQNRKQTVQIDDQLESAGQLLDELLLHKEQVARLNRALCLLTPRRQEIISLRFFAGLRNQEIAAILQLDERTVASHLCRALEDLKRHWQQEELTHE